MARRRKTVIDITKLNTYPLLQQELSEHPDYGDKDLTSLNLTVYDSFDASIKNVDKAITHLIRYIAANRNFIETIQDEQIISRVKLAKMLGISRQTLSVWINKGFITPLQSKYLPDTETFNTDAVLKELQEYKNTHPEK